MPYFGASSKVIETRERYARIAARLGPEPVRVGLYFPLMRAFREWRG